MIRILRTGRAILDSPRWFLPMSSSLPHRSLPFRALPSWHFGPPRLSFSFSPYPRTGQMRRLQSLVTPQLSIASLVGSQIPLEHRHMPRPWLICNLSSTDVDRTRSPRTLPRTLIPSEYPRLCGRHDSEIELQSPTGFLRALEVRSPKRARVESCF
jgi:hypothetical protein